MCARLIVIVGIRAKDAAQVLLLEHPEVVNALAADQPISLSAKQL